MAYCNHCILLRGCGGPATFWVKLDDLDFKTGAPVKKLALTGGKTYSGNATDKFVEAPLFKFASLAAKTARGRSPARQEGRAALPFELRPTSNDQAICQLIYIKRDVTLYLCLTNNSPKPESPRRCAGWGSWRRGRS